MTSRERLNLTETRIELHSRAGGRCEICGKRIAVTETQLAHRIPQSKANLRKYGKAVVHHPANLAVTCSLRCNSAVLIHGEHERFLAEAIRKGEVDGY